MSERVIDAIVPPETLRDEIAARLATAESRRDVPPAKWRSVTPV
jgi:acetyl-CoA carboxylase carboxyltransferase component